MNRLVAAEWGDADQLANAAGYPLFKHGVLRWTPPAEWHRGKAVPRGSLTGPALYVICREHGNAATRFMIEYVGLAQKVEARFYTHPKAKMLRDKSGQTYISFAPIDFVRGKDRVENLKGALEEIEHLLIWALDPPFNERKVYTLPGMGSRGANAWRIENRGFRFAGRMPRQIIFPWMLIRPGTDRTLKKAAKS